MNSVKEIFGIKESVNQSFKNPERQSIEQTEDYAVKKSIAAKEVVIESLTLTKDNSTADAAYVPMVLYNTDATPPAANTVPIGTIYIQYTP